MRLMFSTATLLGVFLAGGAHAASRAHSTGQAHSAGQAHSVGTYECERNGALCMMLPGVKLALPAKDSKPAVVAAAPVPSGLLGSNELGGGAVTIENQFAADTSLGDRVFAPAEETSPEAMDRAEKFLDQQRELEVFLKSGVASRGDLRSIHATNKN